MKKDLVKIVLSVAIIAICVVGYNKVNGETASKIVEIAYIFKV